MTGPKKSLQVLLVENHPDTRLYTAMCLEETGHEVTSVTGMRDALEALKKKSFDVILSDLGLDDGDGWRLLELAGATLPPFAIAMSGYGTAHDQKKSKDAGYHHHLVKPFTAAELRALINQAEPLPHTAKTSKPTEPV